jgi:3-deoxy-7-phosphoheptulonate synthase
MTSFQASDLNVGTYELLPTPRAIKELYPSSDFTLNVVKNSRQDISNILDGKDNNRTLIIVGPCSIHETEAGLEYADRLKILSDKVKDKFLIVMRVYFTKPRTTTGWKGLINDPYLDDSFEIKEGLKIARKFLLDVVGKGVPAATEALDAIVPQYIDDLLTWNAIGARTAESQSHREMASGLSTPVGFKNGTDGNINVAINAMKAAQEKHHFLGIDIDGRSAILETKGNAYTHLVLRGGTEPNYSLESVKNASDLLKSENLCHRVLVDCSHGNSYKNHKLQELVFLDCIDQISQGNSPIMGLMLESNLHEGNQQINGNALKYGVSITDACISWELTEKIILESYNKLRNT